jgi:hypothetical protein
MNSQALQKRIIDGKLYSHGPTGEWPNIEFRSLSGHGTEEDLSSGTTDAQRIQHPASNTQGQNIWNWGTGSRLQHR